MKKKNLGSILLLKILVFGKKRVLHANRCQKLVHYVSHAYFGSKSMSFVKIKLVKRLRSGNVQNSNAAQLQNLNRMIWFLWVDVRCDVVISTLISDFENIKKG